MNDFEIIWQFVRSCASGALDRSECDPVWHLGAITLLLCIAVAVLDFVRMRAARARKA